MQQRFILKQSQENNWVMIKGSIITLLQSVSRGSSDDSVVKSSGCSSRGPEFNSQDQVMASDALFWHKGIHTVRALIHKISK
ncbi:hypothetical protein I79_013800 [Cricetulus griseus]|uniref:Uncharacterized protein n=1 Tax=Cricetulus griseus TaxID=10029 RepID=G3HSG9_CRIGR|nr:hypothetical protein I79_013800 [Cricetulus griseus]